MSVINKNKLPTWIKNKYIISVLFFVVWLSFFDEYNFIFQYNLSQEKKELLQELYHLKHQSHQNNQFLNSLNNIDFLEKYAREKFLMKKEDEDIFIIHK